MDLNSGSFKTYMKEGDTLSYVNKDSNHPPSITRNLPNGINRILSDTNSTEELFKASAPPYQKALEEAGYKHKLTYQPRVGEQAGAKRRNRKRRVTWFNPPFSLNCTTNIPKVFMGIIAECFPPGHILRSTFNTNTVKVSYRTMSNMSQILAKHNTKVIAQKRPAPAAKKGCNCQDKPACPLPGRCQTAGVVYKAEVTTAATVANNSTTETYTGMTGGPFRKRHYGHDHDMKEENEEETGTTLSRHVHKLRKAGTSFTITWDLLEEGLTGYNPTSGQCRLCLLEKFHIMFTPGVATLNRRREVFSSCRHRRKLTLMPKKAKP